MALRHGAQFLLGLPQAALHGEATRGRDPELRRARVERGSTQKCRVRILDPAQGEQGLAQVGVKSRVSRPNLDGLLNQAQPSLGISTLERNDPRQVECIGMVGFYCKCLFIKSFRL
ncbi:MAG TPA: hypothetical protein VIA19_02720 [Burkholderiales bacterium]|jgi:hypothetical protein